MQAKRPLKSDAQLLDALVAPNNDDASVMIGSPVKDAHKDRSLASFGSPVPLPPVRQPYAFSLSSVTTVALQPSVNPLVCPENKHSKANYPTFSNVSRCCP